MTLVLQCDFALVEAPNLNLVQDPFLLDAFPGVVESRCRPGGLLPFQELLAESGLVLCQCLYIPLWGRHCLLVELFHHLGDIFCGVLLRWVFGRLDEEFLRMGGLEERRGGCVGVESLGAVFEKLV